MAICMDMLREAQHGPASDLLCKDLHIDPFLNRSLLLFCLSCLMVSCWILTVGGSLELNVHLADVIVYEIYFPIAHHSAQQQT